MAVFQKERGPDWAVSKKTVLLRQRHGLKGISNWRRRPDVVIMCGIMLVALAVSSLSQFLRLEVAYLGTANILLGALAALAGLTFWVAFMRVPDRTVVALFLGDTLVGKSTLISKLYGPM